MKAFEHRKELLESERGRKQLDLIEALIKEIWNNDKLTREDIHYIGYYLAVKAEGL